MPSTEARGQQPGEHTGGVGSLPGSKDEQGVAVLPQERTSKTTETTCPEYRGEQSGDPAVNNKDTGTGGVGIGGATDPLKKNTQLRVSPDPRVQLPVYACRFREGAQRSGHPGEPSIQLEPRVHPLGGDASLRHGNNLDRKAMEEWERAADLTHVPTTLCFALA